ncbi:conserved hypothetical protein [Ancylobacter novellus DSM 506]|uniref:Uncharacterized protein n=1 Tax=Ancylobacter novellus (strain ATCC 8093 / DSM 506 / JCM 20403 / CCM 1077 / IAM 12100 / NBRC 12443 / NCIMB 10456) TaxID=639283 RepID=D7A4M7_ANCN5|nr:hypothetical protein [Ancylobacter novellus]ADH89890.1 conserved hypothetical protein [Ancylobacter novellus DSM 506]
MIEVIMYSAIGFLTATLLALLALPAVWRRAVRLTRKRIEGAIPSTTAEILADKDEQRAIFAADVRRLEVEVGKLQARAASQWGEVTRQAEELRARAVTIEQLSTDLSALQIEHRDNLVLKESLAENLDIRTRDLEETRAALHETRTELDSTKIALEETSAREEELKVEHVALTTLRDTLKDRIAELDRHLAATNAHLSAERATLRNTSESLSIEVGRNRDMKERLTDVEARLEAVAEEATTLRSERAALITRVAELDARTHAAETARATTEAEAARITGAALEAQQKAEALAREAADTIQMLRAEKVMLDGALAKAREDRTALQQQLDGSAAALAPSAGDPAADTALLRDRISDIAAEVANLTARLEGPGSPIDALLAGHAPAANGAAPSLADRIIALRKAEEPAANHAAE